MEFATCSEIKLTKVAKKQYCDDYIFDILIASPTSDAQITHPISIKAIVCRANHGCQVYWTLYLGIILVHVLVCKVT